MRSKRFFAFSIASLFCLPMALAGDFYNFHVLGFSSDARFYAFAQSVMQDGSGFADAKVAVVDVATNRFVSFNRTTLQNADATEAQALATAIHKANVAGFGIHAGSAKGQDLLLRLPTDTSEYLTSRFATDYFTTSELFLTTTPVAPPASHGCWDLAQPQLMRLTVSTNGSAERLLQADTTLPDSRSCAHHYSIRRVTKHLGKLVVVLTYQTPGFEGPNVEHMVVTSAQPGF